MALLSRDNILAVTTFKKELVSVPEWGGDVYIRVMTGAESDVFTEMILAHEEQHGNNRLPHLKAVLAILTVCDDQGGRIFDMNDLDMLLSKESNALSKIFDVSRRLNGLTPDTQDEITKNSASDQSNDSGTSLLSPLGDDPSPNGSVS